MQVQRVAVAGVRVESWTVLGDDDRPVEPIERFLAYLTDLERSPGRRIFPPEDWNDALPTVLASITRKPNPDRRHRTCPRAVKRARHNGYRVKKPREPASTRHDGPATILIHRLTPRTA